MTDPQVVFDDILKEMQYQNEKYGTPQERNLSLLEYHEIASEELHEALADFLDGHNRLGRMELTQAATVIIQALCFHGPVAGH